MACSCNYCEGHRQIIAIKRRGDVEEMRKLIDELKDLADNLAFDNEVHEAVRKGDWPGAREIAMDIIRRCDEKEAQEKGQPQ